MAPSGHHLGTRETFSPPSLFPFSCMVSRLEGSTRTLLLTQPLRDSFNSSLSMAPVIEPSDRERESVEERGRTREGEGGRCESRKEWNSIVISGLSQLREPVILLPYRWDGHTRELLHAENDLFPHSPTFTHSSRNRINKLIIIRFTSGYVNRVCLCSGQTPAPRLSGRYFSLFFFHCIQFAI